MTSRQQHPSKRALRGRMPVADGAEQVRAYVEARIAAGDRTLTLWEGGPPWVPALAAALVAEAMHCEACGGEADQRWAWALRAAPAARGITERHACLAIGYLRENGWHVRTIRPEATA